MKVLCQSLPLQQELILFHLFLGMDLCMLIARLGDFKNREPSIILKVVLKTDIEVTLRIRFCSAAFCVLDELFNLPWL